jgi:hypothetical protein
MVRTKTFSRVLHQQQKLLMPFSQNFSATSYSLHIYSFDSLNRFNGQGMLIVGTGLVWLTKGSKMSRFLLIYQLEGVLDTKVNLVFNYSKTVV